MADPSGGVQEDLEFAEATFTAWVDDLGREMAYKLNIQNASCSTATGGHTIAAPAARPRTLTLKYSAMSVEGLNQYIQGLVYRLGLTNPFWPRRREESRWESDTTEALASSWRVLEVDSSQSEARCSAPDRLLNNPGVFILLEERWYCDELG